MNYIEVCHRPKSHLPGITFLIVVFQIAVVIIRSDLREEINDKLREADPTFKGISTRQLRDDIAFMRSSEGWSAPIETFPGIGKKRYYRYDESSFSINNAA